MRLALVLCRGNMVLTRPICEHGQHVLAAMREVVTVVWEKE